METKFITTQSPRDVERMNKTEAAQYIDVVSGEIIGGDETRRVALVSPSGRVQRQRNISRDIDPKKWAEDELEKLRAVRTGDGKRVGDIPELFEGCYGKGQWTVRIWD